MCVCVGRRVCVCGGGGGREGFLVNLIQHNVGKAGY